MTTQEQFEKFRQDYPIHFDRWQLKIANAAWQACQDLNNAERERLIAENAMMRKALELAKVTFIANKIDVPRVMEIINEALSTTPRLVEVGNVSGDEQDIELNPQTMQLLQAGMHVYIIQKD